MNVNVMQVKPSSLYPVVPLESINPQILNQVIESMRKEMKIASIKVISYKGYFFILEGNYEMLAANIIRLQSIFIEILDRSKISFWDKDENVEEQLRTIGMNALYDFEAVGKFTYSEYPKLYKRGE